MDRCYSMSDFEELVVPNYHQETLDSYPSPDMWGGWSINTQKAAEKCFDFDVINNGFSGGLYSEMGTSGEVVKEEEEEEEESKRFKEDGDDCFNSSSVLSLQDFDGIQQMDDMFLSSILEDVPGNTNLDSFKKLDNDNNRGSSDVYLESFDGREVPLFHYNLETCQNMPFMGEEELKKISDPCEENMEEEPSTEEVVLQDLQRATEKLTDVTRKCFRDTFYRLAKNAQQKLEPGSTNSEEFLSDRTRNRSQKTESETNSIDRIIANLTFNKMESNMRNLPLPKRVCSSQG